MPTIEQIRAARALLGWNQHDLAEKAGLSQTGIARIENGTNQPNSKTLEKITKAFDDAEIEFIGDTGLRKRTGEIKRLQGSDGLYQIMNDIYEYAQTEGSEICLYNAHPENWLKWVEEDWFYNVYSKNMAEIEPKVNMRIIASEGNYNLISKGHAQNRWLPKEQFISEDKSIYIYGTKIVFLNFSDNNLEILILDNADYAASMRVLFDIAWDKVAVSPQ